MLEQLALKMSYGTVHTLAILVAILISYICFLLISKVDWLKIMGNGAESFSDNLELSLKSSNTGYFSYHRIDDMLRQSGIYYDFGEDIINPATYIILKFALAFIMFFVGLSLSGIFLGLGFMVVGFFMMDIIVNVSNESDNDAMMMDIKRIYDTLKIQLNGSVHLTIALIEAHIVVANPRLKSELQRMSATVLSTNDVVSSVRKFNSNFKNPYIDSLCLTLIQGEQNGNTVQLLRDLSQQIADMQTALNLKEQQRVDTKVQMYELLIFLVVIAFCLYVMAVSMMAEIMAF